MHPVHDQTTQSISKAPTILKTTDRLRLPAALLATDNRATAQVAAEGPVEVLVIPTAEAVAEAPPTLDGLEFVACLERGALGEVWRLRAPNGQPRLGWCLSHAATASASQALRRLEALDHPAVPHLDVVPGPVGQLVLLTDYPERTVTDWARECRLRGLPGIPALELLRSLRHAAEALDQLFGKQGLQHLNLQPGNLWLEGERVRLYGFGLVQLLGLQIAGADAAVNPRYAAPELRRGRVSTRCDQYSLALVYAEAVTGGQALDGRRSTRPRRRGAAPLEFDLFSAGEREILARALHPEPQRRYASCAELIAALCAAQPAGAFQRSPAPLLVPSGSLARGPASLDEFIRELLVLAGAPTTAEADQHIHYRLEPGKSLTHRCAVNLIPGAATLKLEGFREEWAGDLLQSDCESYVIAVRTSPRFWQRMIGRQVGLEIHVHTKPPVWPDQRLSEVYVVLRPFGCGRSRAVKMLKEAGPMLLESLRAHLQALPEQRTQERVLWHEPLRVHPVEAGLRVADGIDCVAKDISARGIGIFVPQSLSATHLYVNYPRQPELADVAALVRVVRGQRCPDGWYEVGALFAPE